MALLSSLDESGIFSHREPDERQEFVAFFLVTIGLGGNNDVFLIADATEVLQGDTVGNAAVE